MRDFALADAWFILGFLGTTLQLSLLTFAGGLLIGVPLALARSAAQTWLRYPAQVFIRTLQGMPVLVQLMICYFAPPVFFGTEVEIWTAAVVAFSVNASSYAAEILRGAIAAVPRGQVEAARAIGLGPRAYWLDVILPQAMRLAVAPLINLGVGLIKGTSIASILGLAELTRAGLRVNQLTYDPLGAFGIVCLAYFLICWPLSLLGQFYERRLVPARN